MVKNKRKKLKRSLTCCGFTRLPGYPLVWNIRAKDLFENFPVPPFVGRIINTDRMNSFCRVMLDSWEKIIWIGKDDIIQLVQLLGKESITLQREREFFFCPSSDPEYLNKIRQTLDPTQSIYIVLSRKLDEPDLIKLVMTLNQEKKVFVGPAIGAMSEYARLLFVPFYPIETDSYRFWHHSELLYLPLTAMDIFIQDLIQGCEEGFSTLIDLVASVTRTLLNLQLNGIQRIYFIADTFPVLSLLESLLPLWEESWNGSENFFETKILTFESLKGNYLERVLTSDEKTLFFIINLNGSHNHLGSVITLPDALQESTYLGRELSVLNNQPYSVFNQASLRALKYQIKKNSSSYIDLQYPDNDLYSLGLMTAFFYYFTCYGAWLRGYDILNDPPFAEFDRLIWRFLNQPE